MNSGSSSPHEVGKDKEEQHVTGALVEMGFPADHVASAIEACGHNSSMFELIDFIHAHYCCDAKVELDQDYQESEVLDITEHNGKQEQDVTERLIEMGFPAEQVSDAIRVCGKTSSLFELSDFIQAHYDCCDEVDDPAQVCMQHEGKQQEDVTGRLIEMGFPVEQVSDAIKACGDTSSLFELSDFIQAHYGCCDEVDDHAQVCMQHEDKGACTSDSGSLFSSHEQSESNTDDDADRKQLKRLWKDYSQLRHGKRKTCSSSESEDDSSEHEDHDISMLRQKKKAKAWANQWCASVDKGSKMNYKGNQTGFGVPGQLIPLVSRKLDPLVQGPPFFYFENVACMPAKSWETIKRHFHGVGPEFVDSKYFSASKRSRGYVHNLPIEGRELIIPTPPMTIHDALPQTREYWPSWDYRTKLNCIVTRRAANPVCSEIRKAVASYEGRDPPFHEQKWILKKCKFWNLVWVGPGQVAPLEPHEMEMLLGFDHEHTRGASTMTERYTSLGNSFQVNTVAYHLSPLRKLYPQGMNVLTLFSGIGGAEVALHKIGIFLKAVVSVELNKNSRNVVECWWRKTDQKGRLISLEDVQELTNDTLSALNDEIGGFDLIIGGSPCNNLSGNNRVTRSGLRGEESCLFYEFPRILSIIRNLVLAQNNR